MVTTPPPGGVNLQLTLMPCRCCCVPGKIYPSRDEYEAHQERVLARISKHNNQQALSHSIEEGLKIQAMTRWLECLTAAQRLLTKSSHSVGCHLPYTDCSAVKDTQWRMAVEQKIMETPPTAATPPSTVTRLVLVNHTSIVASSLPRYFL